MKFKKNDLIRGIDTDNIGYAIIQVTSIKGNRYNLKWIHPDQDNREGGETCDFIDARFKSVPEWYLKEMLNI